MKKLFLTGVLVVACATAAMAQTISFGLGDLALEASLNEMNATAAVDLPGFYAEINLQWGIPVQKLTVIAPQVSPAELYLSAALASISGKPVDVVVTTYSKNKSKGWGALAKDLGIKPGSKEFKALKDKTEASKGKFKGKKK